MKLSNPKPPLHRQQSIYIKFINHVYVNFPLKKIISSKIFYTYISILIHAEFVVNYLYLRKNYKILKLAKTKK